MKHFCIDCSKPVYRNSIRCKSCNTRFRFSGKKNYNYIDGRSLKRNNCIDCGKDIHRRSTRCRKCSISFSYRTTNRSKKIAVSLKKNNQIIIICKFCKKSKEISYRLKKPQFCSTSCAMKYQWLNNPEYRKKITNFFRSCHHKRSLNEIYFYELCQNYFKNVIANKPMFNGWDADVIIEDKKIAVLWNGIWHYKKIHKKHSVKQVQNRDQIKIKEIKKCDYNVYIIKDLGRYNKLFVEAEFIKFVNFLSFK